ncbi:hypothetical protein SFRURICE_005070, partial [Spodoptera frugiperda]
FRTFEGKNTVIESSLRPFDYVFLPRSCFSGSSIQNFLDFLEWEDECRLPDFKFHARLRLPQLPNRADAYPELRAAKWVTGVLAGKARVGRSPADNPELRI